MSRLSNIVIASFIVIVIALSFGGGFLFGRIYGPITPTGTDVINQAWDIINSKYIDKERLNADNMTRGAIEGIIRTLNDPYTTYLTSAEYQLITEILQGEYGEYAGIGAWVSLKDGELIIVKPILDSPAEKAGIKTGDVILEINGESTAGLDLDVAASKLMGPEGSTVKLLIQRASEPQPLELEITRAIVKIPSVDYEIKQDIAWITIAQFTARTDTEFVSVMQKLEQNNIKGIILDLRDNGGGITDIAFAVASHFLHDGIVSSLRDNLGNVTEYEVDKDSLKTDLPTVVLVNEWTASSSEIVASALQDYGRAIIAGNTTYGKGSATVAYVLNNGSALNVTIFRWLTPNGRLIEGQGIEPDIKLELTGEEAIQWAIDYLLGK